MPRLSGAAPAHRDRNAGSALRRPAQGRGPGSGAPAGCRRRQTVPGRDHHAAACAGGGRDPRGSRTAGGPVPGVTGMPSSHTKEVSMLPLWDFWDQGRLLPLWGGRCQGGARARLTSRRGTVSCWAVQRWAGCDGDRPALPRPSATGPFPAPAAAGEACLGPRAGRGLDPEGARAASRQRGCACHGGMRSGPKGCPGPSPARGDCPAGRRAHAAGRRALQIPSP